MLVCEKVIPYRFYPETIVCVKIIGNGFEPWVIIHYWSSNTPLMTSVSQVLDTTVTMSINHHQQLTLMNWIVLAKPCHERRAGEFRWSVVQDLPHRTHHPAWSAWHGQECCEASREPHQPGLSGDLVQGVAWWGKKPFTISSHKLLLQQVHLSCLVCLDMKWTPTLQYFSLGSTNASSHGTRPGP